MALNIPLPNFNVQTPDIMGAQEKALTLAALRGNIAMQPLQQQLAKAQVQSAQTANQLQQQKVQSNQAMIDAWKDPDFSKGFTGTTQASASGLGFDPQAMMKSLLYKPDGTPRGVTAEDANAMVNQFVERSKNMAEISKTNAQAGEAIAGTAAKGYKVLGDRIADILDMPAAKASVALAALKNDLVNKSQAFAGVPQDDLAHVFAADLEHLPAMASMIGLDQTIAEHHKAQADATAAQQKVINPATGMSPEQEAEGRKQIAVETNPDVQKGKVAVAKAEASARESVQLALEPIRLQIQQQFGNMKDARDKIESSVLKPYQEKMTDIQMAQQALAQAQDNPVAARAAVFKMVGVSQPTGAHRVIPAEIAAFQYPGGISDKIVEKWNNFLKGEPWTPEISQAANAFIEGQAAAAQHSLNSGVDNVNKLYGTQVGAGLKSNTQTPSATRQYQGHTYAQQPDGTWKRQ